MSSRELSWECPLPAEVFPAGKPDQNTPSKEERPRWAGCEHPTAGGSGALPSTAAKPSPALESGIKPQTDKKPFWDEFVWIIMYQ